MKKIKSSFLKSLPMIAIIVFQSCSSTNQTTIEKPIVKQAMLIQSDSITTIKPVRSMNKHERDVAELLRKCGMAEFNFIVKPSKNHKKPPVYYIYGKK